MSSKVQPLFIDTLESFPIGRKLRRGDVLVISTDIKTVDLTKAAPIGDTDKQLVDDLKKLFKNHGAFHADLISWSSYGISHSDTYYVSWSSAHVDVLSIDGTRESFPRPVLIQESLLLKKVKDILKRIRDGTYDTDAHGRIVIKFDFDKKIQYGDDVRGSGAGFMVVHDRGTNDIWQMRFLMAANKLKYFNDAESRYPEWKKYLHKWEYQ